MTTTTQLAPLKSGTEAGADEEKNGATLTHSDTVFGNKREILKKRNSWAPGDEDGEEIYDNNIEEEHKDAAEDGQSANPKNWTADQVSKWLFSKNLKIFIPIFDKDRSNGDMPGVDGQRLLELNKDRLLYSKPYYFANWDGYHEELFKKTFGLESDEIANKIDELIYEVNKLISRSQSAFKPDPQLTFTDLQEIRRRMHYFIARWETIIWIQDFADDWNREPNAEEVANEFAITPNMASLFLMGYHDFENKKNQALQEMFEGFNISHDCVVWWKLVIGELKSKPRRSIWLIFEEIALFTPTNVGMELLEHFRYDLTRFSEGKVNGVCQNLVVGSSYPVCAALQIAKWMKDRGAYDISRSEQFENLSEDYIEAAIDYMTKLESDHLATVLLEAKSDIFGMSALDMALDYELLSFVSNNRVERVYNSIMNQWQFLEPENKDKAFQIEPLSLDLFWQKLKKPYFYFTPLGVFASQFALFIIYLLLFTYLSAQGFRVHDDLIPTEFLFWICNIGFALFEGFSLADEGISGYFSQWINYFDFNVAVMFVISLCLRMYAYVFETCSHRQRVEERCYPDSQLDIVFVLLWGIVIILLYLRVLYFCVLSHTLGPMVRMVARMMSDIWTFMQILLVMSMGFAVCLVFVLGKLVPDLFSGSSSGLTLFRSLLGDFEWDQMNDIEGGDEAKALKFFGYFLVITFMVLGSIILLNLLIAMMAKTFDSIESETTAQIIFARFKLAMELDTQSNLMPPPLNILGIVALIIFYLIDIIINCFKRGPYEILRCCRCKHCLPERYIHFDLAIWLRPTFLKRRTLALDSQLTHQHCRVLTSAGYLMGEITDFDPATQTHVIAFTDTKGRPKPVIIGDKVLAHSKWELDLYQAHLSGYLNIHEFDSVVDHEWTMDYKQRDKQISSRWICLYCRQYVQESKFSVKRLANELNVSDAELRIVNRVSPVICPNCYRVRTTTKRWRVVWEIISWWIFFFIVKWILFFSLGFVLLLGSILDPESLGSCIKGLRKCGRRCQRKMKKCCCYYCRRSRRAANRPLIVRDRASSHHARSDTAAVVFAAEASSSDESSSEFSGHDDMIRNQTTNSGEGGAINSVSTEEYGGSDGPQSMTMAEYRRQKLERRKQKRTAKLRKQVTIVVSHYEDAQLVDSMFSIDKDPLFGKRDNNGIWKTLHQAKRTINPYLLKKQVEEQIIHLSIEDEITELEFFQDIIGFKDLVHFDRGRWEAKLKPMSTAIFQHVQCFRDDELPLHLFMRYPFDPRLIVDDFESWWNGRVAEHKTEENQAMNNCSLHDILEFMREEKPLRLQHGKELVDQEDDEVYNLISRVVTSEDLYEDAHKPFDKFVAYLEEVRSLFTETRVLKNMLRDIRKAVTERGAQRMVVKEEVDMIFADIRSDLIALPIFRAMKMKTNFVQLWTIRNFLKVVFMLRNLVRKKLLEQHAHIYVNEESLLAEVMENFADTIIDKEGEKRERRARRRATAMVRMPLHNPRESMNASKAQLAVSFGDNMQRSSSDAVKRASNNARMLRKTVTTVNVLRNSMQHQITAVDVNDDDEHEEKSNGNTLVTKPSEQIAYIPSKILSESVINEDASVDDAKTDGDGNNVAMVTALQPLKEAAKSKAELLTDAWDNSNPANMFGLNTDRPSANASDVEPEPRRGSVETDYATESDTTVGSGIDIGDTSSASSSSDTSMDMEEFLPDGSTGTARSMPQYKRRTSRKSAQFTPRTRIAGSPHKGLLDPIQQRHASDPAEHRRMHLEKRRKKRQKRLELAKQGIIEDDSEDDSDDDYNEVVWMKKQYKRAKRLRRYEDQLKTINTRKISKHATTKVLHFIFQSIQRNRNQKITVSTLEEYQAGLPVAFRGRDSLEFVYNQLRRYLTFSEDENAESHVLTLEKFEEILQKKIFDEDHQIDAQTVPNYGKTINVYSIIKEIFDNAFHRNANVADAERTDNEISVQSLVMTIGDATDIILLFYRMFTSMSTSILNRSNDFVVKMPVFQKFVDRHHFTEDLATDKWSRKAKEAASIFQAVLDSEQDGVTLAEIRQTLNSLIADIHQMSAGSMTRIKNYLSERVNKDSRYCLQARKKYIHEIRKAKKMVKRFETGEERREQYDAKTKNLHNPSLNYGMVDRKHWRRFMEILSEGYVPSIEEEEDDIIAEELAAQAKNNQGLASNEYNLMQHNPTGRFNRMTSVSIRLKRKKKAKSNARTFGAKERGDTINEDEEVEHKQKPSQPAIGTAASMTNALDLPTGNEEDYAQMSTANMSEAVLDMEKARVMQLARYDTVFRAAMEKYTHRITLQQLIQYLKRISKWFNTNACITDKIMFFSEDENQKYVMQKRTWKDFPEFIDAYFKREYFFSPDTSPQKPKNSNNQDNANNTNVTVNMNPEAPARKPISNKLHRRQMEKRDRELRWIFEQCQNEFHFITVVRPFVDGSISEDIEELLESSQSIQGNYELRAPEFEQVKHQLHVSGPAAVKLFYIIRANQQALSWHQLLSYVKFLLKTRNSVREAIRSNKQGEDADLSLEKMKIELRINSDDDGQWLFDTVDNRHSDRISWKHIRKYIGKQIEQRQSVKDFFVDRQAQRNYQENGAEMFLKVQNLVHEINTNTSEEQYGKYLQQIQNVITHTIEQHQLQNNNNNNNNNSNDNRNHNTHPLSSSHLQTGT